MSEETSLTRPVGRTQRGAALVLVLMVAAVFLILMGSLIDVLAIESQNAIESADADAALMAAYSGVDVMTLAIEEYYHNAIQNGQFPTTASCAFNKPGGGTVPTGCNATVIKSWNGNGLNYYLIESTGQATPSTAQEVDRTVHALVKEIPFGVYAMFTVTETSNTGGAVWYSSGQQYGGPVYSGGNMHIRYDSGNTDPIFPNGFTTSGDPKKMQWFDIVDNTNNAPNTKQEYNSVYGTSAPSFKPAQALPGLSQNLIVFSEAYYGDAAHADPNLLPGSSAQKGVFANAGDPGCATNALCTGIFVQGDAVLKATSVASANGDLSSGSQTWEFDPVTSYPDPNSIPNQVTVTVDFGAKTTTVDDKVNGKTVYAGSVASGEPANGNLANGAIFANGNVTVTDGSTVHGQYTLAVPDPPQAGETMTLEGSLKYSSDPLAGPSQDELALWADKIWLKSGNDNPVIDGMILTGFANECSDTRKCGGFFANWYCTASGCSGGGMGKLKLYGGLIENMRGKMGVVAADGTVLGGYLRNSTYDPRLGANPPPFSPTTNLYSIVALSDHGTTTTGVLP